MDLRSRFIQWYYNEFHCDTLFADMAQMTENSPWHRERNIGIHTDMVVAQFLTSSQEPEWSIHEFIGALACAFHDTGKPVAVQYKHSEARGDYKSFGGHEIASARLWEDWAARNWLHLQEISNGKFLVVDLYTVSWLIENHLPYDLRKAEKLDMLARTAAIDLASSDMFLKILQADATGRISEDRTEKLARVADWCDNFKPRMDNFPGCVENRETGQPHLILPMAPSGAGKSTFFTNHLNDVLGGELVTHYSWDELRMRLYLSDQALLSIQTHADAEIAYNLAYTRSCDDKDFNKKCWAEYTDLVKARHNIYVDNTNLSRKRRRPLVQEARRHGYYVTAVLMPCALETMIERQLTRDGKTVPEYAVKRHYMSLQMPLIGEVDNIKIMDFNLPS